MSEQNKAEENTNQQSPTQTEKVIPEQPDKYSVERMMCTDSLDDQLNIRGKDNQ